MHSSSRGLGLRKSDDTAVRSETSDDVRQSVRHNRRRHDESGSCDSNATLTVFVPLTWQRLNKCSGNSTAWVRRFYGLRIPALDGDQIAGGCLKPNVGGREPKRPPTG